MKILITLSLLLISFHVNAFECSEFKELEKNKGFCKMLQREIPGIERGISIQLKLIQADIQNDVKSFNNELKACEDAVCYRKQHIIFSQKLYKKYMDKESNEQDCTNSHVDVAFNDLRTYIKDNRLNSSYKFYVSNFKINDARSGDSTVDLDGDGKADKIFYLEISDSTGRPFKAVNGIVTQHNNCLINVGGFGVYESPYTGSSGAVNFSSLSIDVFKSRFKSHAFDLAKIEYILNSDVFDVENFQILSKSETSGCAGSCGIHSYFMLNKETLKMQLVYKVETDAYGLVSETFHYPKGYHK